MADDLDEIDNKIERAQAQFENGQFYTAKEPRADMGKRKAEWLAARQSVTPETEHLDESAYQKALDPEDHDQ